MTRKAWAVIGRFVLALAIIAAVVVALAACGDGPEPRHESTTGTKPAADVPPCSQFAGKPEVPGSAPFEYQGQRFVLGPGEECITPDGARFDVPR